MVGASESVKWSFRSSLHIRCSIWMGWRSRCSRKIFTFTYITFAAMSQISSLNLVCYIDLTHCYDFMYDILSSLDAFSIRSWIRALPLPSHSICSSQASASTVIWLSPLLQIRWTLLRGCLTRPQPAANVNDQGIRCGPSLWRCALHGSSLQVCRWRAQ